ncbi:hypothetical protein HRG84_13040 [Flavisolibacter sp. BT320]|nr:hypothetical protein [Flavisolibacter longurius]
MLKPVLKPVLYVFCLVACQIVWAGCSKKGPGSVASDSTQPPLATTPAPPATWQEHWFEHRQLLARVFHDTTVVVYFDKDVLPSLKWPNDTLARIWNYTKKTYGSFGKDARLYAVFHTGKYSGGHPSTYMDASHDYRNVIDVGSSSLNAWITGAGNDLDIVAHEVGHIVESAVKGVHRSPAFPIWHDSKWMEIYQYDLYLGLGWKADAQRWFNLMEAKKDDYPRANTRWFVDWFYPLYTQHGGSKVLDGFFALLAKHFPKQSYYNGATTYPEYSRDMNFGEFIHFWSGAAKADLKDLALQAFGDKDEKGGDWRVQLAQAKKDFAAITY